MSVASSCATRRARDDASVARLGKAHVTLILVLYLRVLSDEVVLPVHFSADAMIQSVRHHGSVCKRGMKADVTYQFLRLVQLLLHVSVPFAKWHLAVTKRKGECDEFVPMAVFFRSWATLAVLFP